MALALHQAADMNAFKTVFAALFVSALVACSGGPDTTTSSSSSGGSPSTSDPKKDTDPTEDDGSSEGETPAKTPTNSSGATTVACSADDPCGYWFCDCEDDSGRVTPVNGRSCQNGWCMDAKTSCPDACSAFGKTWTGTAGGGPDEK